MRDGTTCVEFRRVRGDRAELVVHRDCSVVELCDSLGLSKPARQRVLAQEQLKDSRVNEPLRGNATLRAGDELTLLFVPPATNPLPCAEPAEVLWHDRFALAANKPVGLLVHGDGTGAPTLTARVQVSLAKVAGENGWPYVPAAQAVNRLDVDTSGIVLMSLTQEFQPAFDALMARHALHLHKRYLAIVEGAYPRGPQIINEPIARDRHDARRMRVGKTGKPAQTRVACLERKGGRSLLAIELDTGRRHQIRVHLSHAGHAIVGDALYGHPGSGAHLMLHAYNLDFAHPVTGERVVLTTEWPQRFAELFVPREVDWSILSL